jgi:hypothetical protein
MAFNPVELVCCKVGIWDIWKNGCRRSASFQEAEYLQEKIRATLDDSIQPTSPGGLVFGLRARQDHGVNR